METFTNSKLSTNKQREIGSNILMIQLVLCLIN